MNFKNYIIESFLDDTKVTTKDIYSFYYVAFILQTQKNDLEESTLQLYHNFLLHLKQKYLTVFTNMVVEQIKKYIIRGRIEPEYKKEMDNVSDLTLLDYIMKKTFRSDMIRRNIEWEKLTENLILLRDAKNIDKIIFYIDRINNCIHNTHEQILTKLENGYELLKAFDIVHKSKRPEMFRSNIHIELNI